MTKIIGFLITKKEKNIDIDFFKVGLNKIVINFNDYHIYLWGIGNITNYKINGKYSLSFPLNDNLLDRNVLIYFQNEKIIIENDWLGSIPVFYNQNEKIVSTISNFCIKDKTIHKEGLSNFCEFGYSVFEQTMFEDVKFMRYYSKLIISNDELKIEYKEDPVLDKTFLQSSSTIEEVIDSMQKYILDIENKVESDIILPTSGGYDSRMLNYLIKDKSRIRSFTYGISKNQSKSFEVVYAKKISEIYNTKWEQIPLDSYHKYINQWFSIYGISTHLHGMYHIEFYSKIVEKYRFENVSFLSGIFGDIWAGSVKYEDIDNYQDLIKLGYTHGMNLDLKYLNIVPERYVLKEEFFKQIGSHLKNNKIKAVFTIRLKLILISYLTQIPEYFGFPVSTPFLNFEIVKKTLNLPENLRKDRVWQKEFFKKVGLNLEDMNLKTIKSNKLDYEIAKNAKFELLDIGMLEKYFDKQRIKEINNTLRGITTYERIKNELLYIPKIGGLMRIIGFKNEYLRALYDYYILKAIEKGLMYEF